MIKAGTNLPKLILAGLALFFLISGFLMSGDSRTGWFAGYGVGLLAIILHYVTSLFSKRWNDELFFVVYTPAIFVRLIIVLAIFIGLLVWEKFDQFSFTVSFLISYICHSVINIILLNKELTNRSG
ncbi:hypothetical protein DYD21_11075 [Rhodohalobacter sp. SW132]|uniref:hypothetical protein n=1 Tax=Rhodohalobacter sp. SW132 TaxID=2293433 RepID=UPI000E25E4A5|nr:hypothetical protein [Rhodohalobacter sp. SW132]REL33315.1 hypothetical protein DYD21_11075 [Rhodohalobacter sp. SW132]